MKLPDADCAENRAELLRLAEAALPVATAKGTVATSTIQASLGILCPDGSTDFVEFGARHAPTLDYLVAAAAAAPALARRLDRLEADDKRLRKQVSLLGEVTSDQAMDVDRKRLEMLADLRERVAARIRAIYGDGLSVALLWNARRDVPVDDTAIADLSYLVGNALADLRERAAVTAAATPSC